MRYLIISTFISLACVIPASARDSSRDQFVTPNAAQSRLAQVTEAMRAIERDIRLDLALAGFTDIQIVPTSFMVSAKDRDGHSVTLMTHPGSTAELGEAGKACEQEGGSSVVPSGNM